MWFALLFMITSLAIGCTCDGLIGASPERKTRPERIVSLAPSVTEILFALDAGDRVVGVTRFCNHPKEATSLPVVGGFTDINVERVLGLKPDLIIGVPNVGNQTAGEKLQRIGLETLFVRDGSLEEMYEAITTIAGRIDEPERGRDLVADIRREMDAVTERVRDVERPRVLLVYGHNPLSVAGPGSFGDELVALAGGENVVAGTTRFPTLSIEVVLTLAPQVIIDTSMGLSEPEVEAYWGRWPSIPAVKNGRVYVLADDRLVRPGPRLPAGLRIMASALHPDRFK